MIQNSIITAKKVLIITYAFPPHNSSAVHRPLNFVKFLPHYGWTPIVVTPEKNVEPLDDALVDQVPTGIAVREVFSIDPENLKAIIHRKKNNRRIQRFIAAFCDILIKVYSIIYYRIVIVDWYDGWIPFGFREGLKVFKETEIDLIYVHGEPPCSFLIGVLLKKVFRKPLVVDYDDSWTTSLVAKKSKRLRLKLQRFLEHIILDAADKILSVKESTLNEIKQSFQDVSQNKFKLITNGYNPEDFITTAKQRNNKFLITYTGKISNKLYYSPETFLLALSELIAERKIIKENVQVDFIGYLSPTYKKQFKQLLENLDLTKIVNHLGYVEHKKSLERQKQSDLLLYLIESSEGAQISEKYAGVLPAKIFEYIYSGVPIFAIMPLGKESQIILETQTGFIAEPNNVNSIKEVFMMIYGKYRKGTLKIKPVESEVAKYMRKRLTGNLADTFNAVTNIPN